MGFESLAFVTQVYSNNSFTKAMWIGTGYSVPGSDHLVGKMQI